MHIARPESGVMLSTGIVGAGPPVAVGLAMAAQRKGLDRVTAVSFGDGATNTGSFHEAANMAALWDLPVVLRLPEQPVRRDDADRAHDEDSPTSPTGPRATACRVSASTATTRSRCSPRSATRVRPRPAR